MLLLLGTLASTSTTRSYQLACLSVRLLCHSAAIVVEGYSIKVVTSISYNGIISLRTICLMNLNKLRFYHNFSLDKQAGIFTVGGIVSFYISLLCSRHYVEYF